MNVIRRKLCAAVALAVSGVTATADVLPTHQTSSPWFTEANANIAAKEATAALPTTAKNIILFVGDGMGITTLTGARIFEGQTRLGIAGEQNELYFENFPNTAIVKTYNTNSQVPDSAGTMGAMVAGLKTDIGVFGYDETVVRGDCTTTGPGNMVTSYLEMAEVAGMSTGIISTARITHATPGALYAKTPDRNYEDISDIPEDSSCAGTIEDIASQLVNLEQNMEARFDSIDVDGVDVVMGGGRRHFLPKDIAFNQEKPSDAGAEGDRTDGRDLTAEWLDKYGAVGGVYVMDQAGFNAINTEDTSKIFALFNESHMQYEADRGNDIAGEPSLAEMTAKAIGVLDNNDKGFFLMVESGRIDHAHHAGNAYGAFTDTVALADAVRTADELTSDNDTLILVTADHSHVLTIGGYVNRGNPILGLAKLVGGADYLASDGLPFTTVNYNNGIGFCDLGSETDSDVAYNPSICPPTDGTRTDLTAIDTTAPGYHQEALVPLGSGETHAGEDISLHAKGPGSQFVRGTIEQSMVFHIMNNARPVVAN